MKKKELLNEVMGVPKAVDFWVDYFSWILMGMVKGITKSEEIEEAPIGYENSETGEKVESTAYRGKTVMDGKQFTEWVIKLGEYGDLKGLLNNPNFKKFPLFKPDIDLMVTFFPDEMWKRDIEPYDFVEAAHSWSPSTIKLSKLGADNVVFVGSDFSFTIYAPVSWLDNFDDENFKKLIKSSIGHELTHAFEAYVRFKRSGDPFSGRETFLNPAKNLMRDDKYPQWSNFLHLVYLHLSFEINARITQLYYEMKGKNVSNYEEFNIALKESSVWSEIQKLENFNAKSFINSFQSKEFDFFEMLDDMGKNFERVKKGLKPITSTKTPHEGMTHLIDGWNHTLQVLNTELTKNGLYKGKLMDEVPPRALKDPEFFFQFFEKRFHKKAETFKRKTLRLASLLLDEKTSENIK